MCEIRVKSSYGGGPFSVDGRVIFLVLKHKKNIGDGKLLQLADNAATATRKRYWHYWGKRSQTIYDLLLSGV